MLKKQQSIALVTFIATLLLATNAILFGTQPGLGNVALSTQLILGILAVLSFPITSLFWLLYTFKPLSVFKWLTVISGVISLGSVVYIFYDQLSY